MWVLIDLFPEKLNPKALIARVKAFPDSPVKSEKAV